MQPDAARIRVSADGAEERARQVATKKTPRPVVRVLAIEVNRRYLYRTISAPALGSGGSLNCHSFKMILPGSGVSRSGRRRASNPTASPIACAIPIRTEHPG